MRIDKDKPIHKLTEKDWKVVEEEAMSRVFELIKKHISVYVTSNKDSKVTTIEFDLEVNNSKVYKHKSQLKDIGLKNY
ncbi:hypothetical protein [Staphylococcus gallinarum]|uniref:hypothetical protein n=1 Tax=Staphylococcus gallinarum TaxID=1293 RepID=UPI0030C0BB79